MPLSPPPKLHFYRDFIAPFWTKGLEGAEVALICREKEWIIYRQGRSFPIIFNPSHPCFTASFDYIAADFIVQSTPPTLIPLIGCLKAKGILASCHLGVASLLEKRDNLIHPNELGNLWRGAGEIQEKSFKIENDIFQVILGVYEKPLDEE